MSLPLSSDEIKKILKEDTGFNKFLESVPSQLSAHLKDCISDIDILSNAIKLLPEPYSSQAFNFITEIVTIPTEAKELYQQGKYIEARKHLLKSLALYENPPITSVNQINRAVTFVSKRVQALFFDLLAEIENTLGNIQSAKKYHMQALSLAKETGDIDTIVKATQGLGTYHWHLGDFEKALESCHQALDLISDQPDRWQTGIKILTTLSVIYHEIGHSEEAYKYADLSVDLSIQNDDESLLSICLNNLACLYLENGDYEHSIEALEYSLSISVELEDLRQKALIQNNLSMAYLQQSSSIIDSTHAKEMVQTAYETATQIGSKRLEALSIGNSGNINKLMGDINLAHDDYLRAIEIYHQIGAKHDQAVNLCNLGNLLKEDFCDPTNAIIPFKQAIKISESIRHHLKRERDRIGFMEKSIDPYAQIIDCFIRTNRFEEAIEFSERAKSRSLFEFLSVHLTRQYTDTTSKKNLKKVFDRLDEIGELQESLNDIATRLEENDIENGSLRQELDLLSKKLNSKESELEIIYAQLNKLDPDCASRITGKTISTDGIRRFLDQDSLFIEMFQGEHELHLLLIDKENQSTNVSINISAVEAHDVVQNLIKQIKSTAYLNVKSHNFVREVRKPLINIYDLIIKPILPILSKYKLLIFAPHLIWHQFPFHALYDNQSNQHLCDLVEIDTCPSASVLELCMQKNTFKNDSALLMARNNGDLPHVELEVAKIAPVFYPNATIWLGEKAHIERLRHNDGKASIVHLACHGSFQPDRPLSSSIDIPTYGNGQRQTYLLDLFELKLNCNLATISACNSGLSRFTSADEQIGLSRGLFYAGAASVLLSLWIVADDATCYFMENFYWHLVKNRRSKTKSLQLAMQAVKAEKQYAHPFYWAPFVIMGDWR